MITEFIDGPLWYFSLLVFVVGIVWRLFSIFTAGGKKDLSEPRESGVPGAVGSVIGRFVAKKEIAPQIRLQVFAGYIFHLGLFALLFFAAPHVEFLKDNLLGFGWTPLPYWAFIVSAQLAFLGLLMLWLHRLLNPVTRLISSTDDHAAAILTFIVMLTGCLALLESYSELRVLHRFTVELLLIYFPFSRLMHAITFIPSRAYTGAWFGRRGVHS
jgi:nitrate reductase gamma subunit